MTTVKTKKLLMYLVFAVIFVFGGIEYAVVLPTLWLYLHNIYDAPEYMLGLVLSAYSLAAFFSSPVFGRLSDKVGCTKQIFIVCATFELAGSFLYFIGVSQWLCFCSRFISGMGAASEAIALAEVSRYTTEAERTSIISNLVATRQIALLIGPALNLFLRKADFKIGPFEVNKYTAPGAFMSVMWVLLMLIVLLLYTEPKKIYEEEKIEQMQAEQTGGLNEQHISRAQITHTRDRGPDHLAHLNMQTDNSESVTEAEQSSSNSSHHKAVVAQALNATATLCQVQRDLRELRKHAEAELNTSDDGSEFVYPPLTYDQANKQYADQLKNSFSETVNANGRHFMSINNSEGGKIIPTSMYASDDSDSGRQYHDVSQKLEDIEVPDDSSKYSSPEPNILQEDNAVNRNIQQPVSNGDCESGKITPASFYGSNDSDSFKDYHDTFHSPQFFESTKEPGENTSYSSQDLDPDSDKANEDIHNTIHLSSSLDLIISAERLIHDTQFQKSSKETEYVDKAANGPYSGLVFKEDHFSMDITGSYTDVTGGGNMNVDSEKSALRPTHPRGSQAALLRSVGSNDPYIERSTSAFDDPIAVEGKMGFFCNEYIRDEIVAIVLLLFCAMFSQVCVETMVLPLSFKYLDYGELENSIFYCICGVEIIIVFLVMSRLTRCLSDRVMMMFGAVMILSSNVWLIIYLPKAPVHNRSQNMPFFAIAVFLDVLSLPFLIVCATSLYSKLTRKQTQGLSQGLRRGVVGLGTVIAPLWGSSAANQPYLLLGVLVGLQSLSLILCILSFKRLKVRQPSTSTTVPSSTTAASTRGYANVNPQSTSAHGSNNFMSSPLLINQPSGSTFSTPYGSIQRSIAGSSYRSVAGSPTEEQPLLSRRVV